MHDYEITVHHATIIISTEKWIFINWLLFYDNDNNNNNNSSNNNDNNNKQQMIIITLARCTSRNKSKCQGWMN